MSNYAEVLEGYLIPEPAEEGILGVVAAPFVLIGGITLLASIQSTVHKHKLIKYIRENDGKAADYSADYTNDIYLIMRNHSSDITGVLEPVSKNKYVSYCQKLDEIGKKASRIRDAFCSIDPKSTNANSKYIKINSQIESLPIRLSGYCFHRLWLLLPNRPSPLYRA